MAFVAIFCFCAFILFIVVGLASASQDSDANALCAFKAGISNFDAACLSTLGTSCVGWATSCNGTSATAVACGTGVTDWTGVTCDGTVVTELILISYGFTGTIAPAISSITGLQNLRLFNNSFKGKIPDISALTELLELYVADNDLR